MKIKDKDLEKLGGSIKILKNGNRIATFASCEITQKTIEFLVTYINVKDLLFHYCDFKDVNLSTLNKSNITTLSSMHGNFNDEHLQQLEVNLSLKTLKLHDTKVSKSAINQFLLKRPDVKLI